MREPVKVLFGSATPDLIPGAIQCMAQVHPELPLIVVSEFRPETEFWIRFHPSRSFWANLALIRWHLRGKRIRFCGTILQPRMPYWSMRWMAFLLAPLRLTLINEYFGAFPVHPRAWRTMLRHIAWRSRGFLRRELSPGGVTYTYVWRLGHPHAFLRPINAFLANLSGLLTAAVKAVAGRSAPAPLEHAPRPQGISVVIPSRNGRRLLARTLGEVVRQIERMGGEVIVVDNGSDDGTPRFLRENFPRVTYQVHPAPLSFAAAVNEGIRGSRYSHVCLLNNDMFIREGFFEALLAAFSRVPDLFCATAQIFFPEGMRREETGKAVMPFRSQRTQDEFPLRCELPFAGEDLSYVLYGSGGCSLFDAAKLQALGGLDEVYNPAYIEDLDLGFRGWRAGWPSVFVARAQVIHKHRATTSRFYSRDNLDFILELHYLRFLVRTIADARVFRRLWREAVWRLNVMAARQTPHIPARMALATAWRTPHWMRRSPRAVLSDEHILAIGSGNVTVTPGREPRQRPVVLVVSSYIPFPLSHGGAVRIYNLMDRAARDFDLVLITFNAEPGEVPRELRELCCEIVQVRRPGTHLTPDTHRPDTVEEFDLPAYHAALRQTVRKWKPAVAQIEFTQMALYAADCAPAKTILVEHDITFDLYQQLLRDREDWETRRQLRRWIPFETAAWRQVDHVVVMSEKDRALVLQHGHDPEKVSAIPNGVDLERFRPAPSAPDPRRLLFIGSFRHFPNVLAMDFFLREVWPHLKPLGATLHIIAGTDHRYFLAQHKDRVQLDLGQPGLEVEDFVADVRPAYERAAIVIAPLLASAGTNIKIMEAMAMGKAIVSTPAGINGLDLTPDIDVVVTEAAHEMARRIRELMEDTARREELERRARATVERKYGWDAIACEQKRLYDALLTGAYPAAAPSPARVEQSLVSKL